MYRTILSTIIFAALVTPAWATPSGTLDNLQAAFNGESNAHAKYVSFAEKADRDGYPSVASLFRAAATAEEIHAKNHAEVIAKLGGSPSFTPQNIDVKSTAENLQDAINGETYERDEMYPRFLTIAREEDDVHAVRTFNYALKAEAEHARLYAEALKKLPSLKGVLGTYYVCTVCGYTTTRLDFERCLGCLNPKDKYVAVS